MDNNRDVSIDWVRELLECSPRRPPSSQHFDNTQLPTQQQQQRQREPFSGLQGFSDAQQAPPLTSSTLETLLAPHTGSEAPHVRFQGAPFSTPSTLQVSAFQALVRGTLASRNPRIDLPPNPAAQAGIRTQTAPYSAPFPSPVGRQGPMDPFQSMDSFQSPGTSMMPEADVTSHSFGARWATSAAASSGSAGGSLSHPSQIHRTSSDASGPARSHDETKKMLPELFAKIFVDMLDSPASSSSAQQSLPSCSSLPPHSPLSPSQPQLDLPAARFAASGQFPRQLSSPTYSSPLGRSSPRMRSPGPPGQPSQPGQLSQRGNLSPLSQSSPLRQRSPWGQPSQLGQQHRNLPQQAQVGGSFRERHVSGPGLSRQASLPKAAPNASLELEQPEELKKQVLLEKLARYLNAGSTSLPPLPLQQLQQQTQQAAQQHLQQQLQQQLQQAGTEELLQQALQLEQLQQLLDAQNNQPNAPGQHQHHTATSGQERDQKEELLDVLAKFLSASEQGTAGERNPPLAGSRPTLAVPKAEEITGYASAAGTPAGLSYGSVLGSPSVLSEGFLDSPVPGGFRGDHAMPRGTPRARMDIKPETETPNPESWTEEGGEGMEGQEGEEGMEDDFLQNCGPGKRKRILRERQRRSNMRDQVKRLHSLLPKAMSQSIPQDTVSIIAAAADFIEELKKKCDGASRQSSPTNK